MTAKSELDQLWNRIDKADSTPELVALLRDFQTREGVLSSSEYSSLVTRTLNVARDFTLNAPEDAKDIIEEFVLPLSLKVCPPDNSDLKFKSHQMRSLLGRWLDSFVDTPGIRIRDNILATVLADLRAHRSKESVWTIGVIGYRTEQITSAILEMAKDNGELGTVAVGTLGRLGLPPALKASATDLVWSKIASNGLRPGLLYTLQEIASKEMVDSILGVLPVPETPDAGLMSIPLSSLLNALTHIASRNPHDHQLQDRIWSAARQYRDHATSSGGVATRVDTTQVLIDFARWVSHVEASKGTLRFIYYDRMSECIRPKSLDGWSYVEDDEFLSVLRADAIGDSRLTGGFVTTEARRKQLAFETAICLSKPGVLDWLDAAVTNETSGYVQEMIFQSAACFRILKLPEMVTNLIVEECDISRADETDAFVARTGAILLAQSAGTRQAFDALCKFGFTYDGQVLRTTSDALSELANARIEAGDRDIVDILLRMASLANTPKRQREAGIDALCSVITHARTENLTASLFALIDDPDLDGYSRRTAMEALGFLDRDLFLETVPRLVQFADVEGDLGWRAIEALARQRLLQGHEDILVHRVGLQKDENGWSVSNRSEIGGWQSFIVGLLYRDDVDSFSPAVVDILDHGGTDAMFQVIDSVRHYGRMTPEKVVDAITSRIYRRSTKNSAETFLFGLLGELAPERLASEQWDQHWSQWLPEARAALSDVLGETPLEESNAIGHAVALLAILGFDGIYAVRRAAYRAMSAINIASFVDTCGAWARELEVRFRLRAAEAARWIPEDATPEGTFDDWGLTYDIEPSVRDIAKTIIEDRHKQRWMEEYLNHVLAATDDATVFAAYRYGRALVKIGDDSTARQLRKHLASVDLAGHVKHWIRRIIKDLEQNWSKTTANWPQPWFNRPGVIEEVDGVILVSSQKKLPAHFSLWRLSQTGPSDLGKWGGAAKPAPEVHWSEFLDSDSVGIEIPNRAPATAILSRQFSTSTDGTRILILSGSGAYPEPLDIVAPL